MSRRSAVCRFCHPDVKRAGTLEELKLLSDTMEKMPDEADARTRMSVVLTDEKEMYDFGNAWRSYLRIFWRSGWTNERTRNDWREEPEKQGDAVFRHLPLL